MKSYVLLIRTNNEKSLIHNISGVLFIYEVDIIESVDFVDKEKNIFYKRTEFLGEINEARLIYDLYMTMNQDSYIELIEKRKKDIVVFCTKEHHCLGDLLLQNEFSETNSNIKAVISNYDVLKPLVNKFNIPFHYVSADNKTREEHEKEIYNIVVDYNPDLLILAKYMRILSPFMIEKFKNKILNIHHSFLPAFIGANPYRQAYDRGVKIIGATTHIVTEKLDEGPIIAQEILKVDHTQLPKDLAREGKELEKHLLTKGLKLLADDRVFITENKTIIFE